MPPVGVNFVLPLVLRFFGFAAADPNHPHSSRFERVVILEWAISVLSGWMLAALADHRAFLVSDELLALLSSVAPYLPAVPPTGVESGRFRPWTFTDALSLINRARLVDASLVVDWDDYATTCCSRYAYYHEATDSFRPDYRPGGQRWGQLNSRRENAIDGSAFRRAGLGSASRAVTQEPPVVEKISLVESTISLVELRGLEKASSVLGSRISETWCVGSLIETLARWYNIRTDELYESARDLRSQRDVAEMAKKRAEEASAALSEARASLREVREDRDRLRQERASWWPSSNGASHTYGQSGPPTLGSSITQARNAPSRPDPYPAAMPDPYAYLARSVEPTHAGSSVDDGPPRLSECRGLGTSGSVPPSDHRDPYGGSR